MSEHSDPHGHSPDTGAGVPRIHPVEAWERLRERPRDLLVDVRSTMEFLFVGHPAGAIHIPWIDEPDWTVNPDFVPQVRKLRRGGAMDTAEDAPSVYLICRSGKRTLAAAEALRQAGVHNV